jgi:hypothetical protein
MCQAAYLKSQGPSRWFSVWDALKAIVRDSVVCHGCFPLQSTLFNSDNYSATHVEVNAFSLRRSQ